MNDFAIGTSVGLIQTVVGHPLDTIKTNFQNNKKKIKLRNLYNGLRFPLISTIFTNGLIFYSHSKFESNFKNSYLSGFATGLICSPIINILEVYKVQYQLNNPSKFTLRNLGLGFNATILRESIGTSLYFGVYYSLKKRDFNAFTSGGIAGSLSWLFTYPIDVIKTRIQSKEYTSYLIAINKGSLFNGLYICLLRSLIVNSISFTAFDYLKN